MSVVEKQKQWKQGWYFIDERWFLTEDAIQKEFKLTEHELAQLFIRTYKEGKRIEVRRKENNYNFRKFDVYCRDDIDELIHPPPPSWFKFLPKDKRDKAIEDWRRAHEQKTV